MTMFSVIVPTRNRSSLLSGCIKSALAQTFPDFEVLVCDNNSTDNTAQLVQLFAVGSSRIRYVNSGKNLSMNANWELALQHARGRYVLYLADDDALVPEALRVAAAVIERTGTKCITWGRSIYNHPDVPEPDIRGTLYCNSMSGVVMEVDCRQVAKYFWEFCGGRLFNVTPKALNGVLERGFLSQCVGKFGRFFSPPFPDSSTTCHVLGRLPSYLYIDAPLYVCGVSRNSNAGLKYDRKNKIDDFVSLFSEDILAGAPPRLRYFTASYFLATFLRFSGYYPTAFPGPPDMSAFFGRCWAELGDASQWEDAEAERSLLVQVATEVLGSTVAQRIIAPTHHREESSVHAFALKAARSARMVLGRGKRAVLGGLAASRPMGSSSAATMGLPVHIGGVMDSFAAAQLTGGFAAHVISKAATQPARPALSCAELMLYNH